MILLLNTFLLSQFMDLIMTVENADDFSDNFFVLLAMLISCCKLFSMLANRKNIIKFTNILTEKPCKPLKSNEIKILSKFDKHIETNTWRFVYLVIVTFSFIVLTSLSLNFRKRKLTYRAWLPFNYSSTTMFYLTYSHQLLSLFAGGFLNVGCDTLICGLLVHISCQIEILAYRLREIMSSKNILPDCVRQHYNIFKLAFIINATFRLIISIQFMISMLIVCFSLYQLTKTTVKAKFIELTLYMICMLTQIFLYCWYGNEVKLKSRQLVDDIFEMEWLSLDKSKKKSLMIIMKRAIVPIQITSAYIIPINLDSFMGVCIISFYYRSEIGTEKYMQTDYFIRNFTENFYATLASVVSCSKMFSLLVNRNNINMLTNKLIKDPYKPLEIDEINIRYKFDRLIHTNTLCYTILVESTCICITMTSLLMEFRKGHLTYRAWIPYNYHSSTIIFCLTYAHQLISLTAGSLVNVACDSLICGLLVHICCQFEILEYRLNKISKDSEVLRDCVRHHDSIFEYAIKLNDKFKMTIAMQFMVSTMVVCSNLYQMTKSTSLNASILPLLLYMSCMLTQIFIYCWYGNEVKLKSIQLLDNIFRMDWVSLDKNHKESLLIIMNRAAVPIEFTSAYVLSMNLDSFVGLLKTSYSAYNILKQV
nr:PREDICTED: odorant receptor 49b-like [Linepithema humile]